MASFNNHYLLPSGERSEANNRGLFEVPLYIYIYIYIYHHHHRHHTVQVTMLHPTTTTTTTACHNLHKGMPLNWGYGQKFNGMPLCKLQVLAALCTPINGGSVVFDPLSLALVVLILNHCAHVLLGMCSGLKGAGVGAGAGTPCCISDRETETDRRTDKDGGKSQYILILEQFVQERKQVQYSFVSSSLYLEGMRALP